MNILIKRSTLIVVSIAGLWSCKPINQESKSATNDSLVSENIVEVITNSMEFQLPGEIRPGWNTFRYINNSNETHFFILEKLPEGIRIENYKNELIPPFISAFNYFDKGDIESGMQELGKIPPWFSKIEVAGGVGLISPKSTAETTINLETGVYAMECYVRMPNGLAHAFVGMLNELVVSGEKNTNEEPLADYEISVSSVDGVTFQDTVSAGNHTFAVKFEDQKKYETLLGHDVNLVQLTNNTSMDSLASWINAADIKAFRTPSPAGYIFLGGVQDLPAGEIGYFKASMEPGNYVLISEVPDAIGRNLYHTFVVI